MWRAYLIYRAATRGPRYKQGEPTDDYYQALGRVTDSLDDGKPHPIQKAFVWFFMLVPVYVYLFFVVACFVAGFAIGIGCIIFTIVLALILHEDLYSQPKSKSKRYR